jgi:two-component system CheB/CheR fusion protein
MPKSAFLTGAVDMGLTPEEIARELARIDGLTSGESRVAPVTPDQDPYRDILALLGANTGENFDQYEQNTIRRRVERRIFASRSARTSTIARRSSSRLTSISWKKKSCA